VVGFVFRISFIRNWMNNFSTLKRHRILSSMPTLEKEGIITLNLKKAEMSDLQDWDLNWKWKKNPDKQWQKQKQALQGQWMELPANTVVCSLHASSSSCARPSSTHAAHLQRTHNTIICTTMYKSSIILYNRSWISSRQYENQLGKSLFLLPPL